MGHVTHMNESCHKYENDTFRTYDVKKSPNVLARVSMQREREREDERERESVCVCVCGCWCYMCGYVHM